MLKCINRWVFDENFILLKFKVENFVEKKKCLKSDETNRIRVETSDNSDKIYHNEYLSFEGVQNLRDIFWTVNFSD